MFSCEHCDNRHIVKVFFRERFPIYSNYCSRYYAHSPLIAILKDQVRGKYMNGVYIYHSTVVCDTWASEHYFKRFV